MPCVCVDIGEKMNLREEIAVTEWQPAGALQLRRCLGCGEQFSAGGPDTRRCPECEDIYRGVGMYEERAKTKWKPAGVLRLRLCINCGDTFASAGPDERRCSKCEKKMCDARARPFMRNEEMELKQLILDWFDEERIERRQREALHDTKCRRRRQKEIGLRS